jgi:hypothetical protein
VAIGAGRVDRSNEVSSESPAARVLEGRRQPPSSPSELLMPSSTSLESLLSSHNTAQYPILTHLAPCKSGQHLRRRPLLLDGPVLLSGVDDLRLSVLPRCRASSRQGHSLRRPYLLGRRRRPHLDFRLYFLRGAFFLPSFASVELIPASSQAVYPEVFLGPETGWVSCIVGTAWSLYLISMFSFHVRSFPSSSPFRQFTPSTPRIVLYVGHHTPRHTSRP